VYELGAVYRHAPNGQYISSNMDVVPAETFFLLLFYGVLCRLEKKEMIREKKGKRLNDRQLGAIGWVVHHKSPFLPDVDRAQFNQLLWVSFFFFLFNSLSHFYIQRK
jgi:hypothetical protein